MDTKPGDAAELLNSGPPGILLYIQVHGENKAFDAERTQEAASAHTFFTHDLAHLNHSFRINAPFMDKEKSSVRRKMQFFKWIYLSPFGFTPEPNWHLFCKD
jgi:hypothetical protein